MNTPISFLYRALAASSGLLLFTLFDFSVAQRFTNHLGMMSVFMPVDRALSLRSSALDSSGVTIMEQ